jgi:hypothetical protein
MVLAAVPWPFVAAAGASVPALPDAAGTPGSARISSARQSANCRISRPETSCITPRPNWAAGPLMRSSVLTRTRVPPSAGSSWVVMRAAAVPSPRASRACACSTARPAGSSASSIRTVPR